ncbi:MAG: metallophosphoesterase [Crenarchaeota archaeon]|nr:metallophosphoesterase [Thermoproteota archaeon]
MKIAATADIHSPKYLSLFIKSLKELEENPDVFVLAGDIVYKNKIEMLRPVIESIRRNLGDIRIIGVFGNEEYRDYEEKYIQRYPEIVWLNDSYVILEINGLKTGFIGTRGALDRPTTWQLKNMPGIQEYYDSLPGRIEEIAYTLQRLNIDKMVLISHYGVTYRNLRGEPRHVWPHLASRKFEKIVEKGLFDLVIHGHAHNAVIDKVLIGKTPVYNVSLPARKKIVMIELSKYQGLERWIFRQ